MVKSTGLHTLTFTNLTKQKIFFKKCLPCENFMFLSNVNIILPIYEIL